MWWPLTSRSMKFWQTSICPTAWTSKPAAKWPTWPESFGSLGQALVVGLGLIYFVLASQFESFIMPVIVMMILPIGLVGSLFGLPMTGRRFRL